MTPQGVVVNDENGATVHRSDGSVLTKREDGTVEIMNPRIERVEVHDLRTLVSHQVQRVKDTTSYHLVFAGSGEGIHAGRHRGSKRRRSACETNEPAQTGRSVALGAFVGTADEAPSAGTGLQRDDQ